MPPLYEDAKRTVDPAGNLHYTSVDGSLTVLNDGEAEPEAFMRNAKRMTIGRIPAGETAPEAHVRVLMGKLTPKPGEPVYVYVKGNQVIMSTLDRQL